MERHKRVKILSEKGKDEGNVRIEYNNIHGAEQNLNVEAQTINLEKGQITTSKIANIVMADKSMRFKRSLGIEESYISVHYEIEVKRTQYLRAEYPICANFIRKCTIR